MNLWFRLLGWLLKLPWATSLEVLSPSRVQFRVMPTDLDLNFHMNNGRFLTLMDLGRMDLVARTGLGKVALKKGWRPIAGAISIRYLKPLMPFQSFTLETRILGWEGKWFYLEQNFWLGEQLAAQAYFKGLMVGKQGSLPVDLVLGAVGYTQPSPELSPNLVAAFKPAAASSPPAQLSNVN